MFSTFINPLTLTVGGLLVATPIIIHLINRIRFRRVKWAAMEFLLKAQKKMRRKKILEQLILLFLRCLLVFLAGVLFARYLGGCIDPGQSRETKPTSHVIVLDDTPSMADSWRREDGGQTDAFTEGKRIVVEKLLPAAAESQNAQTVQLIRLSDPEQGFPARTKQVEGKDVPRSQEELREEGRVNAKNITELDNYLKALQVSPVRRGLVSGLRKAKDLLEQAPAGDARVIHVVSDLRAVDWSTEGQTIEDLLRELKDSGITVHLIDVMFPARTTARRVPQFNDNVSIIDLKPRNRVVSLNQQTELEITLKNNGATDLKDVRIDFYLNGTPDIIKTIVFPTLPANQVQTSTVTATFGANDALNYDDLKKQLNDARRAQNKLELSAEEERVWKAMTRFRVVTAVLATPEPGGLTIDNARHTVVEVRPALKVLIVDGRTVEGGVDLRKKPEGDSYYLRTLLETKAVELGYLEVVYEEAAKLDKMDLRPFTTIYLMNVPGFTEAAVKNIEKYVSEGGGVGIYLGQNVKADDYNRLCYKGGTGFFPVPLAPDFKELTDKEKEVRAKVFAPRILLRGNKDHPALRRIYLDERGVPQKDNGIDVFFRLPNIDAHWPVSRRGAWRDDKDVQELYCLQNESPIAAYEDRADKLVDAIKAKWGEPKFEKARKFLDKMLPEIKSTPKGTNPLSKLAELLDDLLCDVNNTGDESEPILRDFWNQPELAEVKQQAMLLRDEAKYGDPLCVVKKFKQGRVAVMTSDCGGTYTGKKQWNDWPSLGGVAGWVVVAGELQKYLAGGGDDSNRSVGDKFFAEFDFQRYHPSVIAGFITTSDPTKHGNQRLLTVIPKELGKHPMDSPTVATDPPDAPKRPFQLKFNDTRVPGIYLFALNRKKDDGPSTPAAGAPDQLGDLDPVAAAFNVDALNEGDLRREATDEIEKRTSKAPLYTLESINTLTDSLKQKPSDYSSRRWLYLLILLVLIAEQAWAVRISYHTKPEDLEALAPSAAAAYAHHSVPPPASAGEAAEGAPAATS
jgi:hypothetical protein